MKESEKIVSYVFSKLEVSDVCEGVGVCPGSQEDQAMFNVMKNAFIANGDELESCSVCDKVDKADSSMSTVKVFMKQACLEVDDDQLKRKVCKSFEFLIAQYNSQSYMSGRNNVRVCSMR